MTTPELFPQEAIDAHIAKVFATPAGRELLTILEEGWLLLTAPAIHAAIERQRERWSTGGPIRTL